MFPEALGRRLTHLSAFTPLGEALRPRQSVRTGTASLATDRPKNANAAGTVALKLLVVGLSSILSIAAEKE